MTAGTTFSDILTSIVRVWGSRQADEPVLSLALPINGVDPLYKLPFLAGKEKFRFLWDGAPGRCMAAAGKCQYLEISGAKRFELAQRFSDVSFGRLLDVTTETPAYASPRILLSFAFLSKLQKDLDLKWLYLRFRQYSQGGN